MGLYSHPIADGVGGEWIGCEKVVAAACRYDGLVCALPQPARHHHIIRALATIQGIEMPVDKEQGFVTNTGRFVNREEAAEIALKAKQVLSLERTWLASEDLW